MHPIARDALLKLMRRAESAWARNSPRLAALRLNASTFPAYGQVSQRQEKLLINAAFKDVARRGGIRMEVDALSGDAEQVTRIAVMDADRLSECLEVTPLWRAFAQAAHLLAPSAERRPRVQSILDRWRTGQRVRLLGPENAQDVVDADHVLTYLEAHRGDDQIMRRVSAQLFSDSKRIETIWPVLDFLTGEQSPVPRQKADVLAEIGLLAHPQPLLVCGRGIFRLTTGESIAIPKPYIGLPPECIRAFEPPADLPWVLSVENLTTFHEIAREAGGEVLGLVLYTAGMPSPAWRRSYKTAISSLPSQCRLLHWGDIDDGGYRIALTIAEQGRAAGLQLQQWKMDWSDQQATGRELTPEQRGRIARSLEALHWNLGSTSGPTTRIEQEALVIELPKR
ncbi:MAG TPA: Wadjet anti-phage system protein JetD domain-containing protein [Rudaea sp.]|jgi:hypothetical protein